MSLQADALHKIDAARRFFARSTSTLGEADSAFRATPETWTAAAQIAHVAQAIDWFRAGALDDDWRLDFEVMTAESEALTSLTAAREWLDEAWDRLSTRLAATTDEELSAPMADNPILGPRPRYTVISAIAEHTGHHRGALAVYARLLGRTPPMPYAED